MFNSEVVVREIQTERTPSPWFWAHSNALAGGGVDGDWTLVAAIHDAGRVGEADAALIAAAPELLEACKDAVDDFASILEELKTLRPGSYRATHRIEAMRDAVAKAEGRYPTAD